MTKLVRVSDGFSVYIEGKGQVGPATVVEVDNEQAHQWIERGWVMPVTRKSMPKTPRPT